MSEHIQILCLDDPAFARKVMHPSKSMVHCIWYINRKANLDDLEEAAMAKYDFGQIPGLHETLHQSICQWFQNKDNWCRWTNTSPPRPRRQGNPWT